MRSERLLRIFGDIDEKFISEIAAEKEEEKRNRSGFFRLAGAAAGFLLIAALLVSFLPGIKRGKLPVSQEELPILTPEYIDVGYGPGNGILLHDISELGSSDSFPGEKTPETMYVYKNLYPVDFSETQPADLTKKEIKKAKKAIRKIGRRLGMSVLNSALRIQSASQGRNYAKMIYENDSIRIEMTFLYRVNIILKEEALLPEVQDYPNGGYEEAFSAAVEEIVRKYGAVLGMREPKAAISNNGFNIYNECLLYANMYDAAADEKATTGNIMPQNFRIHNGSYVGSREEGESVASEPRLTLSGSGSVLQEIVGAYPIVSEEEAEERLRKGYYLASYETAISGKLIEDVPYNAVNAADIEKSELTYYSALRCEFIMPYYRFYVKTVPAGTIRYDGLYLYEIYYVPAISGEYLNGVPTWEELKNKEYLLSEEPEEYREEIPGVRAQYDKNADGLLDCRELPLPDAALFGLVGEKAAVYDDLYADRIEKIAAHTNYVYPDLFLPEVNFLGDSPTEDGGRKYLVLFSLYALRDFGRGVMFSDAPLFDVFLCERASLVSLILSPEGEIVQTEEMREIGRNLDAFYHADEIARITELCGAQAQYVESIRRNVYKIPLTEGSPGMWETLKIYLETYFPAYGAERLEEAQSAWEKRISEE